ncbi:MAG: DnaJ domain-containing protein [Bacteroidales bacterium]|nr:DnaJ domain-containing protein [Bacteroidales bacterium]
MFKDYYKIRDVSIGASSEEIRMAYKKQAMKWHPDRNPNQDVTSIMQDINEAYNILKNPITKERYDKEYCVYKTSEYRKEYKIYDEELKNDIYTARKEASEYVREFMAEIRTQTKIATNAMWEAVKGYVYLLIILTIIGFIISILR